MDKDEGFIWNCLRNCYLMPENLQIRGLEINRKETTSGLSLFRFQTLAWVVIAGEVH